MAGMTTNEGLLGDPAFPLDEVVVPPFVELKGDKLYWSFEV